MGQYFAFDAASFLAFRDEMEKIAATKSGLLGRVGKFISEGRKKGFIVDKQALSKVKKRPGGLTGYLADPNVSLNAPL